MTMMRLRCWLVRRRLQLFLDGQSAPHQAFFITYHLAQCQPCEAEAASLRDLIVRIGQLRIDQDPHIVDRLNQAIWRLTSSGQP